FYRLGASTVNIYENNQPVIFNEQQQVYEKADPIGSKRYDRHETIKKFGNIEPRFALSYALTDDQSLKFGYNRTVQYLQLISNTSSPTPLDVWTPSDNLIRPQIGDQVSFGYFLNFNDDKHSLEVENFYKEVRNRIDYIDGADLIANEALEQVILNGEQRAYGIEVLLRKNTGRFNG